MTLIDLQDLTSNRLRNIAHSAGIDLEGSTKKEEVIETLQEEEVRLTEEGWMRGDTEFELQEQVSSPSDKSIIYGFRRSAASDEILEEIQGLLEDSRYELQMMEETSSGKEPVKIIIPAESDED